MGKRSNSPPSDDGSRRKSTVELHRDLDQLVERMQSPESVAVGEALFAMSDADLRQVLQGHAKARQ